jgi:hypothetical protein
MSPIERWTLRAVPPRHLPGTARLIVTEGPHRLKVGESVKVVREQQLRAAAEACLAQWAVAHDVKCGCENPDTAGCDWPVPIPHTQDALDVALGGR